MRKKLIARTAKLLSESRKNRRHQGVAVAYEHIPKDIDERKHGAIYAVVNVKAPAAMAEEVGEVIVDTFHSEYYQDLNRDPVASFEAVLTRVNEELAEITHQGNTAWLGNLHAVLAVISDDTIHLTRTGKAEAYLYRGGRAGHATEGIEGDNINPLRTFAYTGSAELLEGDKMAIATPGVFYHVSKDELQKYVQEFQPKVAISHLADLLEDKSGEVHPNSILIIEAITPEAASEETIPDLEDEIWITESAKPVQTAIEAGTPFVKKSYTYGKKGFAGIMAFLTLTLWPKVTEIYADAIDIARNLAKKEKVIVPTKESIVSEGGKVDPDDIMINENTNDLVSTKQTSPNSIYIKETTTKPKMLNIDFSTARGFAGKFAGITRKLGKNRKAVLAAAVGAVLILGFGIFGAWRIQENAENQKLAEASYTEATSKYEIAQTQISSGNKSQAAETLRNALVLTSALAKNAKMKDQAGALTVKIQSSLDIAEGITRPKVDTLADASQIVGNDSYGPYLIGTNLYLIGKSDASIASISTNGGEVSRVLDKPNLEGKVISATAMPVRSVLVLMTDAGKIYEFDTKDVKLNQQTVSGEFEKSIALASFSTNIYSLDSNGNVYKRMKNSSGYSARTEYITDGSLALGAVSIAIDSSLYAMKPNGEVTKYLGGKKQDYTTTGLPITVTKASQVFTNEDTRGLYELESDSARVIRFDAKGVFTIQYVSDSFRGATGQLVNEETKLLYVVSGGKIYKTAI